MNWNQGLFRLWLVASVTWLLFMAWHVNLPLAISGVYNDYPSRDEYFGRDNAVRTRIVAEREAQEKCILDALNNLDAPNVEGDLNNCPQPEQYVYSPHPPIYRDDAARALMKFAVFGIGPMLGLPILGFALLWAKRGFYRKTR